MLIIVRAHKVAQRCMPSLVLTSTLRPLGLETDVQRLEFALVSSTVPDCLAAKEWTGALSLTARLRGEWTGPELDCPAPTGELVGPQGR